MIIHTLKKRHEFVHIKRFGQSVAMAGFILQAASPTLGRGDDQNPCVRCGFTASRAAGIAVVRNRIKRRMRVLSRRVLAKEGRPGIDYVMIGRRVCGVMPFDILERDLTHAVRRLHQRLDKGYHSSKDL